MGATEDPRERVMLRATLRLGDEVMAGGVGVHMQGWIGARCGATATPVLRPTQILSTSYHMA